MQLAIGGQRLRSNLGSKTYLAHEVRLVRTSSDVFSSQSPSRPKTGIRPAAPEGGAPQSGTGAIRLEIIAGPGYTHISNGRPTGPVDLYKFRPPRRQDETHIRRPVDMSIRRARKYAGPLDRLLGFMKHAALCAIFERTTSSSSATAI